MFDIKERDRPLPTWMTVVVGMVSVVAGVLTLTWPGITLGVLDLLFGVSVLVGGLVSLVDGITGPPGSNRGLRVVIGVLGVLFALVFFRYPGDALLVFVFAAGTWLLVSGFAECLSAVVDDIPGRGSRLLAGVVDVLAGILVLWWPQIGITALALLVGIALVVRGVVTLVAAVTSRRARRDAAGDAVPVTPRSSASVS